MAPEIGQSYDSYPAHEGLQAVPAGEGLEPYRHEYKDTKAYPEVVPVPPGEQSKFLAENESAPAYHELPAKDSRICGLRRRTFFIIMTIVLLVIIAAAVGGGVGGSAASKNSKQPLSSTSTTTSSTASSATSITTATSSSSPSSSSSSSSSSTTATSTTTAVTSVPTTSLGLDCPALNGTTYSTTSSSSSSESRSYVVYCNANFASGSDNNPVNTTSLDACIQACSDLAVAPGGNCVGVVWDSVLNLSLKPRRNCFLKTSASGLGFYNGSDISASALLVT